MRCVMPAEKGDDVGLGPEGVAEVEEEEDQFGIRAGVQGFDVCPGGGEFRAWL